VFVPPNLYKRDRPACSFPPNLYDVTDSGCVAGLASGVESFNELRPGSPLFVVGDEPLQSPSWAPDVTNFAWSARYEIRWLAQ